MTSFELHPTLAVARLGEPGYDLLMEVQGEETPLPDSLSRLEPALGAMRQPEVVVELVAAGDSIRMHHWIWIAGDATTVLAALDEDEWEIFGAPVDYLAASLVRFTRMSPCPNRRTTPRKFEIETLPDLVSPEPSVRSARLEELGATSAWSLTVVGLETEANIWACDGPDGLMLHDGEAEFVPTSNTTVYRMFTALAATFA